MTIWKIRITTYDADSEWFLSPLFTEQYRFICVYYEYSAKFKEHFHALLETSYENSKGNKKKLNAILRQSAGLTDVVKHRMDIYSDVSTDLIHDMSYTKKDGDCRYVDTDYEEQIEQAPIWEDPSEKVKKVDCTNDTESQDNSKNDRKTWSMYDHLLSKAELMIMIKSTTAEEGQEITPYEPMSRRQFARDLVTFIDKDKNEWHPRFRISNWNTFWAYVAQIYWKLYGVPQEIMSMAPSWL